MITAGDRISNLICTVLGKTGRGAGVGAGDQWVKPGDGNWEMDGIFPEMPSRSIFT